MIGEGLGTDKLPPLRQDIIIESAQTSVQGQRQWRVVDPVQNRYFIVGDEDVALLSMWSLGSVSKMKEVLDQINKDLDLAELKSLYHFLKDNYLVEIDTKESRQSIFSKYVQNSKDSRIADFLTYKFPLVRVDSFKDYIFPYFSFLKTKGMILIWFICSVVGVYFALRQIDLFVVSFKGFISFEGLVSYLLSLVFIKFIHEMSHAHTADRYGCQIGRLGVATYFGLPMFYTELDSVARLNSAKKKMRISASGVCAEIYIAGWSTFLWAFLPIGIAKDTFFVLGTTSWIMSVAINLNPFAKFDGYYLLCDFLKIENLHQRSVYTLNWFVDMLLLGFSEKKAELVSFKRLFLMAAFGLGVKLYQIFIIFTVCALLYYSVQHFSILILCFSIFYYFVGLGYVKRIKDLLSDGGGMSRARKITYVFGFALFLTVFFLPLNKTLYIPGVVLKQSEELVVLENAEVKSLNVKEGMLVSKGQVLFELDSKELEFAMNQVYKKIEVLEKQLDRIAGSEQDRSAVLILTQELDKYLTDLEGLRLRQDKLIVKSKITGRVTGLLTDIAIGHSLAKGQILGLVVSDALYGHAFIDETQLNRIIMPQIARFYPDNAAWKYTDVSITSFDYSATTHIEPAELTSEYGGEILVNKSDKGLLVPVNSQNKIRFRPTSEETLNIPVSLRGELALNVEPQSLAQSFWNQLWRILITELRR